MSHIQKIHAPYEKKSDDVVEEIEGGIGIIPPWRINEEIYLNLL